MTLWFRLDGVGVNGVDDLIRALDRDRIDRTFEMEVLRMGPLLAIDIHPIERKPSARQGSALRLVMLSAPEKLLLMKFPVSR